MGSVWAWHMIGSDAEGGHAIHLFSLEYLHYFYVGGVYMLELYFHFTPVITELTYCLAVQANRFFI